jgi:hypothetical protein
MIAGMFLLFNDHVQSMSDTLVIKKELFMPKIFEFKASIAWDHPYFLFTFSLYLYH